MNKQPYASFIELAELIKANVSGPVKKNLIADAQRRLLKRLKANGVISDKEEDSLLV